MDYDSAFQMAASGMSAQRMRMNVIANNIANADSTVSAGGGPYRRRSVVFEAVGRAPRNPVRLDGGRAVGGGVRVAGVVEERNDEKAFTLVYDPGHPQANADGWVLKPNIQVMAEMVNLLDATRAFDANVTMLNNLRQIAAKALEIGRL
ncbi:flagellar basal body rod protein FlgC [bacterium]|nr:flagellar basal body rod protein FlgC [bacterium]